MRSGLRLLSRLLPEVTASDRDAYVRSIQQTKWRNSSPYPLTDPFGIWETLKTRPPDYQPLDWSMHQEVSQSPLPPAHWSEELNPSDERSALKDFNEEVEEEANRLADRPSERDT